MVFLAYITYDEQMAATQEYLSNGTCSHRKSEKAALIFDAAFERFLEQHTRALQILNRVH